MNMNRENNWFSFAIEAWPDYSKTDIRVHFEEGKMGSVLDKLEEKGATTAELFEILNKIERKDVIIELQKTYPFIER